MVGTSYDCLVLGDVLQRQGPCPGVHMEEAVIVGFVMVSAFHMVPQLVVEDVIDGPPYEQLVGKEQASAAKRD
jgi:hypothetical protein